MYSIKGNIYYVFKRVTLEQIVIFLGGIFSEKQGNAVWKGLYCGKSV